MALNKLYYVYGLDTACFYTDEESEIEKRLIKTRYLLNKLKSKIPQKPKNKNPHEYTEWLKNYQSWKEKYYIRLPVLYKLKKELKDKLKQILQNNINLTRTVRTDEILDKEGNPSIKHRVSIFDSNLTRCFELKEREFNSEILIVKVYFFDVAKSIVKNGFYLNGEKYVFFSASAGQIRTKKFVAVREDLLNTYWNTLTAGLTVETINNLGGMNINKYLAYLALCNSATDLWNHFDIDRCIVVDDFEKVITGEVDYIDEKTYKIERKVMDMDFTQTDGCGMILPCLSNKNFMVRLPWVKGLLASFDFKKFIINNNASPLIKDIYGNVHNVISENIQIIFTKSQFKMWKYFKDWEEYKDNFKKYHCTAGKCNVEEDDFPDAVINYQMIQTLSDMNDDEIKSLAIKNEEDINNLAEDVNTMLDVFGATDKNYNKNGFQKCLQKYPELLSDLYSRQTLKDLKVSLEKDLWSAKFKINGKYTFVIPDLYAFCEYLFLHISNPKGLLKNGEVSCRLFDDGLKLDCLRSPHLYREHPIRLNNIKECFNTNAIYISCHDLISKIVQCDYDGDKFLVTDNETIIETAERNMKNIVPLFYNMSKASDEILTPDSLFKGLLLAYNGGNIGPPSNDITKIWNSGDISEEQLTAIKWLVMEVNFIIDYSKTLYKPKRPDWANKIINQYTKEKVPRFFMYAKDKNTAQVKEKTTCVVDRIQKLFPKKKLCFNFKQDNIGKFDYRMLMSNSNAEYISEISERYKNIVSKLDFNNIDKLISTDKNLYNYFAVYENAKKEIIGKEDKFKVIDIIIYDLFYQHKSIKKKAFWTLFGDEVYKNLCKNISDSFIQCERCHKRFYKEHGRQKYCNKCSGYVKQKTKVITCCDCGEKIQTGAKDNKTCRCKDCYEIYRKKRKLETQRIRRKNAEMKSVQI